MSFDFPNAACRFPLGAARRWLVDRSGPSWVALGIRAGLHGYDARQAWHQDRWNWQRTNASLALSLRYSVLSSQQRAMHDAFAATEDCPRELYDILPGPTRAAVDRVRRASALRVNTPVVTDPGEFAPAVAL